jgi:predicted membrane channel-forming protein YqfA (hemolysin III family)
MSLIGILVAIIVVGVLLWGIFKILAVVPIPEPFRTIIWVVVVIIAVLSFVQIAGLYHFGSVNLR